MKKIVLMLVAIFCVSTMQADDITESAVPANVKAYVSKHYPKVKNIEWEYKSKKSYYEAEFYDSGRKIELEISSTGELLASKEDMHIKDIPDFATSYIKKNYPNSEISGGNKRANGNSISYSIGISFLNNKGNTQHRNIVFDDKGNILKR